MRLAPALLAVLLTAAPLAALADPIPAAVVADPPQDKEHPAGMEAFALPVKDAKINAVLYTAAGAGPHPTVLLLHGLPGNEQNLDLARAIQRDGWNVLTLHYRGSWGSPGQFTFSHCIEDAASALAWLRNTNTAMANRIDPAKLVVIGHSLGGMVAAYTGGHDAGVMGTALISPSDLGDRAANVPRKVIAQVIEANILNDQGMHTVGNATGESLADDALVHGKDWNFVSFADQFGKRPLLIVTSNDGLAPASDRLYDKVTAAGGAATKVHLETDHSYNDKRIALQAAVIRWLENLPGAPAGF
ncbi:MAG: alpha/beta fold hydrolase [Pseudomonadota bacterium]|nr:alpha/beta fold hydrolase [Pseudomonadota bacterium]